MPLSSTSRASGLFLRIASLPSPYGIGDMGPGALAWIGCLAEAGQSWWHLLPLGPTGAGNSPYDSLSSFTGNSLLISLDWLIEEGLVMKDECQIPSYRQGEINYNAIIPYKRRLLETASADFKAGNHADLHTAYERCRSDEVQWPEEILPN